MFAFLLILQAMCSCADTTASPTFSRGGTRRNGGAIRSRVESRAFVRSLRANVGPSARSQSPSSLSASSSAASVASPSSISPSFGTVYVTDFGADPTGKNDSTKQLQQAIDYAWQVAVKANRTLEPGCLDLGDQTVDFGGGHFLTSSSLTLPVTGGGNIAFAGGSLHASTTFPRDRFLIEFGNASDVDTKHVYYYLSFEHLEFDASNVAAGGLSLSQFLGVQVKHCIFRGFVEKALWAHGGGNECEIDGCDFFQLSGWDCHGPNKTGTAIQLDNNDHSVANSVISCCRQGIVVGGGASVVRNLHVYTEGPYNYPNGCAYVPTTQFVRFIGCYFDGCPIFLDDATDVEISDSLFLFPSGVHPLTYTPVIITPTRFNTSLEGLTVVNNIAGGGHGLPFPFVLLNESVVDQLTFNHDNLLNVDVFGNSILSVDLTNGIKIQTTRVEAHTTLTNTDTFEIDLSDVLLFHPNVIPSIFYSLEINDGANMFVPHALVSTRNTSSRAQVITVRTKTVVAEATLRVSVDQSKHIDS